MITFHIVPLYQSFNLSDCRNSNWGAETLHNDPLSEGRTLAQPLTTGERRPQHDDPPETLMRGGLTILYRNNSFTREAHKEPYMLVSPV